LCIFPPVLVYCVTKCLATLAGRRLLLSLLVRQDKHRSADFECHRRFAQIDLKSVDFINLICKGNS
jgi:hypothetical protein